MINVSVVGSPYGMSSVAAMASMLSSLGGGGPMNMGAMFGQGPGGGAAGAAGGFSAAQFLQQSKSKLGSRHCEFIRCFFLFIYYGFGRFGVVLSWV